MTDKKVVKKMAEVMKDMGFDLEDENFKGTPARILRYWEEFLDSDMIQVKCKELLSKTFPKRYKGMILLPVINCQSMCPHHMLPVKLKIIFAYMPKNRVVGLSKIVRFIRQLSKRPILQEDLTTEIIECFGKYLPNRGSICIVEGTHTCMVCRGVKCDTPTITSWVNGMFKTNKSLKDEFLMLAGMKGGRNDSSGL